MQSLCVSLSYVQTQNGVSIIKSKTVIRHLQGRGARWGMCAAPPILSSHAV